MPCFVLSALLTSRSNLLHAGGSSASHALSCQVGPAVSNVSKPTAAAHAAYEGCRRNHSHLPTDDATIAPGEIELIQEAIAYPLQVALRPPMAWFRFG